VRFITNVVLSRRFRPLDERRPLDFAHGTV
jgi:hypothetical protein